MEWSSSSLLLRLSLLLTVVSVSVTARPGRPFHPCNTLILFSTTTTSTYPHFNNIHPQNPNFSGPRSITIFFTRSVQDHTRPEFLPLTRPEAMFGDSFYDRTKDILKVVGSLLFGVVCGALTASTMYLLWSLFSPNRFEEDYSEDEVDSDFEDDVTAAKKKGVYVAIPAAKEVA